MNEAGREPLDYAPPPRRERTRLRDLSLADWIILLMLVALLLAVPIVLINWSQATANGR